MPYPSIQLLFHKLVIIIIIKSDKKYKLLLLQYIYKISHFHIKYRYFDEYF